MVQINLEHHFSPCWQYYFLVSYFLACIKIFCIGFACYLHQCIINCYFVLKFSVSCRVLCPFYWLHSFLFNFYINVNAQLPRLYNVYKKLGIVTSFQNILDNVFIPLFEVTIDPNSHPHLHMFLMQVSWICYIFVYPLFGWQFYNHSTFVHSDGVTIYSSFFHILFLFVFWLSSSVVASCKSCHYRFVYCILHF